MFLLSSDIMSYIYRYDTGDIYDIYIYIYYQAKSRIQGSKEKYDSLRNLKNATLCSIAPNGPPLHSFSRAFCGKLQRSSVSLSVSWNGTWHSSASSPSVSFLHSQLENKIPKVQEGLKSMAKSEGSTAATGCDKGTHIKLLLGLACCSGL